MAEQRRRTGLTSGINLLTNLLLQQQQDEMTRRRRAEELALRTDLAFEEEIGKRRIQQGVNPYTGVGAIPGIPQGGGQVPEGFEQFYDAQGNLRVYRKPKEEEQFATPTEEENLFEGIPQGGVYSGSIPINPKLKRTYEEAVKTGRITLPGNEPSGVGSAIRSMGQTLLSSLPQLVSTASQFTPAGIAQGFGRGIGSSIIPSKVAPIPPRIVPTARGGDSGDLVIRVQTALEEGYSPEDILDKLVQSGIDEATAQQIIQEASQ